MAKFCSECGKPLREDAAFCSECGAAIQDTQPHTRPKSASLLPAIAFIVVTLVAGVILVARMNDDASTAPTTSSPTTPRQTVATTTTISAARVQQVMDMVYGLFYVVPVGDPFLQTDYMRREEVCLHLNVQNIGGSDNSFQAYYLSVVTPSGKVVTYAVGDSALWPILVPGADVTDKVCFLSGGERGTFTLRYEPPNEAPSALTFTL